MARAAVVAAALVLAGCASWPRSNNPYGQSGQFCYPAVEFKHVEGTGFFVLDSCGHVWQAYIFGTLDAPKGGR